RLTAGVWNVFLSLHGQKVAGGSRAQQLPQTALLVRAAAPEGSTQAQVARRESRLAKSLTASSSRLSATHLRAEEAFEVIGKELAMLDGLDELISVESAISEARVLVRAPKPPAAVHGHAPVSLTAPRVEALPVMFKFDKLLKGPGLKHFQERVRGEYVRRAASVRTDDAAPAAPHAADYVWRVEQSQPPSRTPSCDTETEEFTF
ncbi:MAG TPA: hypothetical protein VF240_11625, partial [Pyrinomonadaceae bacterium]